jgi:hypothetical protein
VKIHQKCAGMYIVYCIVLDIVQGVKMHSKKRFVFMFQFSHQLFGPLMTIRLKLVYILNNFVLLRLLNSVAPLHHMCEAKEAETTLVALLMVGANYLSVF